MVPEVGDYHALAQESEGRVLVRTHDGPDGVSLISNVCRHRQAIIKNGRGNSGRNIVCPLHRWTYGLDGRLLGAPHFDDNPCLDLARTPLRQWNGLLFEGGDDAGSVARELADVRIPELDFDGYLFDRVEVHECAYNWKTFIEVYLEDYHVGPFHPGLGQFVSCDELSWHYGANHSLQVVGINSGLTRPGTPTYRAWHEQVMRLSNGVAPRHGAIWLTLYPNVMVEWYPHVLVVSTLVPRGPRHTTNIVEFYYPEEVALFERDFVEAESRGVHGDLRRGRRDRAADGRGPARAVRARREPGRPVPVADGRRHAALPRMAAREDGRPHDRALTGRRPPVPPRSPCNRSG